MRASIRSLGPLTLIAVVLAACSGGGATTGPGGATPTPGAPSSGPTSPPQTTAEPTGGGGPAGDVCALVPTGELATILGVGSVTTRVIQGPPDTCDIQADGAPVAAMVLTTSGASFVFAAYADDPSSTQITGIGDRAAYNPGSQLLVVLKGESMLSIAAFDAGLTPEARLEIMKKIATVAAANM